jgi:hypothetical protein
MKTTMLSVIGCALLAAGTLQARAQSTNTNTSGVITLNVNIALTGVDGSSGSNGSPGRVKISTKDVINAMGSQLGTTFSSRAKLIAVDNGSGGGPAFFVRDGTNGDTEVSSLLSASQITSVDNTRTASTGAVSGQRISIDHFVLTTDTLSFDVQGYTTQSVSNRANGRNLLPDGDTPPVSLVSKVNGVANSMEPVQGTNSASGRKFEATP